MAATAVLVVMMPSTLTANITAGSRSVGERHLTVREVGVPLRAWWWHARKVGRWVLRCCVTAVVTTSATMTTTSAVMTCATAGTAATTGVPPVRRIVKVEQRIPRLSCK